MKRLFLSTLLIGLFFTASAQIVWQEDFTGVANNATVDAGATAWSVTTLPAGQFRKQDDDPYGLLGECFVVRNTGTEGVWTSEDIDISAYGIAVIDLTITNIFTSATDYVSVYYQSDNGSGFGTPILLTTVAGGIDQTVGQSAIVKGNQIRLIIRGMENTVDFFIFQSYFAFDNIVVTGVQTLYSRKTGTWNDATANSSWSPFPIVAGVPGASCACFPDNTKRAVIQNGHTISIGSAADATIVDVETGGTLRWTSANDLSLHRGGYLQNEGTVSRNSVANSRIVFSEVYPFTITNNGTFSVDDIVMNATATLTLNGTNAINITDDLLYTADNAVVNNATALVIGSSIQVNSLNEDGNIFNNTDTVSVAGIIANNGDLTINNSSDFGLLGAITTLSAGCRFNNLATGEWWWTQNTNTIPANFTTTMICTAVGNTFNYSGTAAQNIGNVTYYNLRLSTTSPGTSGVKTPSATLDVNGDLSIYALTSLDLATNAIGIDLEGDLRITSSGAIAGAGTTNTINIAGDWSAVSANSFFQNNRTVIFDGAGQTITNSVGEIFYNMTVNNGAAANTVTMANNITVSNTLTLTRGRLLINGNTLNITRNANGAITGSSNNSYIISETSAAPYGRIAWTVGTTNAAFTFPFGTAAGSYIPYVLTKTNHATVGTGIISVATYGTAASNNLPYPSTVLHLRDVNGIDKSSLVVDRFWIMSLGYATITATHSYSFLTSEAVGVSTPRVTQRWDGTNTWLTAISSPSPNAHPYVSNSSTFPSGIWVVASSSAALPVELTKFSAKLENDAVRVSWKTASEKNNDYFTVERAQDVEHFSEIKRVAGNGTTGEIHSYSFVDDQPLNGRSYYRLRQTDFDGKFSFSKIEVVDYAGPEHGVLYAYPSPGDGKSMAIEIKGLYGQKNVQIEIVNARGVVMWTGTYPLSNAGYLHESLFLNSPLPSGLYIIRAGPTSLLTRKIVIK